ncbi:MAG: hypothetical protein FWH40_05140 [Coriobacteriia bacterium]|nr:hypothetical protein [Coriobacteriia bacterium]
MAFKISLSKLQDARQKHSELFASFDEEVLKCDKAVRELSEYGWLGSASIAFYEMFLFWIEEAMKIYDKMLYVELLLGIISNSIDIMRLRYDLIAASVAAFGPPSDIIYFTEQDFWQVASVQDFLSGLKDDLPILEEKGKSIYYQVLKVSFSDIIREIENSHQRIGDFKSSYIEYADNVKKFETDIPPMLELLSRDDFNYRQILFALGLDGFNYDQSIAQGIFGNMDLPEAAEAVTDHPFVFPAINGWFVNLNVPKYESDYLNDQLDSVNCPTASWAYSQATLDCVIIEDSLEIATFLEKLSEFYGLDTGNNPSLLDSLYSEIQAYIEEYNRNPYLPEDVKVANALLMAANEAFSDQLISKGSDVAGKAIGTVAGPLAPVVGILISIGLSKATEELYDELFDYTRNQYYHQYYDQLFPDG